MAPSRLAEINDGHGDGEIGQLDVFVVAVAELRLRVSCSCGLVSQLPKRLTAGPLMSVLWRRPKPYNIPRPGLS